MKTEDLAKVNEENNATNYEVTEKGKAVLLLKLVVGILDYKPIKEVDTGLQLDDDELQGDVELDDEENEAETPIYVGFKDDLSSIITKSV